MYPPLTTGFGDLFAEFDAIQRQLARSFGADDWPSSIRAVAHGTFPALNMGSTADAVEIYAFAPGLDPAKIEVSVENGVLTLAGERPSELAGGRGETTTLYAHERFAGRFKRVIGLPEDVDAAGVQATYRDGVLKVLVPKREPSKPRRVEVKEPEPGK